MRLLWSMLLGLCVASGAMSGAMSRSLAQQFPSQPMRIIVPYPPGGVTDLVGRVVAEGLREKLKVQVVVENKPGGNGIIGLGEFLRAKNDHTLLIGGFGSHIIPPLVNPKYPYDAAKDFLPLAQMAEFVNVMVVSKDLPVKSVQEFIALAKAKPGALNFGTTGAGASNHLTAEMFMQQTGVQMVHVPYKGGTAALQDLAGGQVQVIFENLPPSLGLIQSGTIKVLGVTSDYRVDQLPDAPTMVESGLPNFKVTSWICVFGSPTLSDANRDKLSRTLAEIGRDPATGERFKKIGFEPMVKEAAELKAFFAAETEKWSKVVEAAGIKIEP
jgi:tripartite-type tricarboxylate transporter receptor subunit TctC